MTRTALEHIIRASASIAEDDEIVVVGSQSILAQFPDAPEELVVSVEADVFPRNRPERWDLIDGSIGEESPFHRTFGYYAQGVGEETSVLPAGWKERLVPIKNENTRGATGWCLDVHDLALAKCVAGREKGLEFLSALARHGMVRPEVLRERERTLPVEGPVAALVAARLDRIFGPSTMSRPEPS